MTAACPACAAGPAPERIAEKAAVPTHRLHLPGIHCAACIQGVEATLLADPDIRHARVNLTARHVSISGTPGADPAPWIDRLARAGYEAHEIDADTRTPHDRDLMMRLGVAGFAMMNVMLLSVAVWSGASDATRDMFHWISAAIALPAALFSAQPFVKSAMAALSARRVNMDVPISLAIALACGMSLYEVSRGGDHAYFDAALSLTFFLLAGRALDQRMRRAARSAAADLAALEPRRVTTVTGDARASTLVDDLKIGDCIWLAAGGRVPVDAVLNDAPAQIDRSLLTGESDPIDVAPGQPLYAGDVALTGPLTVTATAVGEGTTLRAMTRLVAMAETARSKYSGLADRAARVYVPVVHLTALAAFIGWTAATGDIRHALNVAVATLIITCPCALGLAVPAVAAAATGRLFRRGLLVKSETALERLAGIDTVVLDKTGTLTEASLTVPEDMPETARRVLKALAQNSSHPLSRSLVRALSDVTPAPLDAVQEHAGLGIEAIAFGQPARLGQGDWIGAASGTAFHHGTTWALGTSETLRPDAVTGVARLKALGLTIHMISGDRAERAEAVAASLGIDHAQSRATPEEKLAFIEDLRQAGYSTLMVGDGLNDVAALTAADVAMAPATALEADRTAADIVVMSGRIEAIGDAVGTARLAHRLILQNFGLAAGYNCLAIPLALAGLATPLMAALAMSTSSITVTLNALRAR